MFLLSFTEVPGVPSMVDSDSYHTNASTSWLSIQTPVNELGGHVIRAIVFHETGYQHISQLPAIV